MKVQPTTQQLIAMLYERLPELFDRPQRQSLRDVKPLTDWQPMETAPKDGTMFMCWVHAVRWGETDEGQQYQQDVSQADFCWWRRAFDGVPESDYFDNASGQIGDSQAITHWMPLIPAPQEEAAHGIKGGQHG